jgi:ATP-binding cassette subfamily B protein
MLNLQKLSRVWPYVRRYRRLYVEGLVLTVISAAFAAVGPLLIKYAIDSLQHGDAPEAIRLAAGVIVSFALMRCYLLFRGRFRLVSASRYVERDMRNDLFRHLSTLPVAFFDRNPTGDLTSRLINDVENIRMMVGFGLLVLANTTFVFLFGIVAMFVMSPWLALISLIPLSLILVVVFASEKRLYHYSNEVQEKLARLSMFAQENFGGIRVVKGFGQEDAEAERFRSRAVEYRDMNVRWAKLRGLAGGSITLLAQGTLVVTLAVAGMGIVQGAYGEGDFIAFTAYQMMMIWPAIALGWLIMLVQRGIACLDRWIELIDAAPEPSGETGEPADFPGRVEFRNLTFAYGEGRAPAVRDVNLDLPAGQRIAIVGRVGSGKTTLVSLLMRLYDPPPGTVFVDGRDVRTLDPALLRRLVACVPQDNFLFSDTIGANLAFGAVNGVDAETVRRACDVGQIQGEIEAFPDRYEQLIGERGLTLSGGQKQRLSIARAVLREPRIVVLDDAFASVDSTTEQEILRRLLEFGRGRTLILITHRLSTVRDMDLIVVMEEGRVVEAGRHEELLRQGGSYAELFERFVVARQIMENGETVGASDLV